MFARFPDDQVGFGEDEGPTQGHKQGQVERLDERLVPENEMRKRSPISERGDPVLNLLVRFLLLSRT